MTKSELEILIRDIIKNRDEYAKVDQKTTYDFSNKRDRVRLVKCITAIANTDDTRFENIGYIILGAAEGCLIGGFDELKKDSVSADMQGWVREYIDPAIIFSVERFNDEPLGWWGVIVIAPSSETHIFKKKFEEQGLNIRSGDLYVRHGDSISSADRIDYDRLQRRKFRSSYDNLANEIRILKEKVEEQKAQKPDLKLYFLDDRDYRKELFEVQPVFWEKTKERLEEETLNETRIMELEKELGDLNKLFLTTQNAKVMTKAAEGLRDELQRRKAQSLENQQNDPVISRIIKLDFRLSNDGNSLATGINYYVHFPSFLELSASMKSFHKQDLGNPKLGRLMNILPGFLASSYGSPQHPSSLPIPDFAMPKGGGPIVVKRDNRTYAQYWIDRLIQHHWHAFDPVYMLSPDNDVDVEIPYQIYAENSPGVMQATLQLNVRPNRT